MAGPKSGARETPNPANERKRPFCRFRRGFGNYTEASPAIAGSDQGGDFMKRSLVFFTILGMLVLGACGKKDETAQTPSSGTPAPAAQTAPAEPASGPHAFVNLKDGSKVGGTVVASSQTDMVL